MWINFFFVSEADYTLDESFWIDESPAGKYFQLTYLETKLQRLTVNTKKYTDTHSTWFQGKTAPNLLHTTWPLFPHLTHFSP